LRHTVSVRAYICNRCANLGKACITAAGSEKYQTFILNQLF